MRHVLMIAAVLATVSHPALAQVISEPSGQGTASTPNPEPTRQSTGSTVLSPGLTQYQGSNLPTGASREPPRSQTTEGRELPEQPAGPLRN
jgi:hypothetical protein